MSAARPLQAVCPRCSVCGVVVAIAPTGRPRRYCSARCRQKAARNRAILVDVLTGIEIMRLNLAPPIDWTDEEHRVA